MLAVELPRRPETCCGEPITAEAPRAGANVTLWPTRSTGWRNTQFRLDW